jgi:hypothetical protein
VRALRESSTETLDAVGCGSSPPTLSIPDRKAKLMTTIFKQILAFGVLAGVAHLACDPAIAGQARRGVDTRLTKQRRVDYGKLVAESLNQNVKPSAVDVYEFMHAGTWTMVYATVPTI